MTKIKKVCHVIDIANTLANSSKYNLTSKDTLFRKYKHFPSDDQKFEEF